MANPPTYPTDSGNTSLGVESSLTQANATRRRELRDVVGSDGLTTLTNPTRTWDDLLLAIDNFEEEVNISDWSASAAEVIYTTGAVVTPGDGAATTTVFDTDLSSATVNDPRILGQEITFTSGDNDTLTRTITAYNSTTKQVTVGVALTAAPANGDTFYIGSAVASTTVFDTTLSSSTDDDPAIVGSLLVFTSGSRAGQSKAISDYDGTTKVVTLESALSGGAPADGDDFVIVRRAVESGFDYDIASISTAEKAYVCNLFSLKIHALQERLEKATELMKNFREDVASVNTNGVPTAGTYPSGLNRGW